MSMDKRSAVDIFFRTLAETHRSRSVAIVLSGVGGDGAIGIKRIKEVGGITVAQKPEEAQHDGMPRSAIETGMVDWVLPVAEMPQRLLENLRKSSS
jgi:two-component system, chemotaxis family, CheB/CheR fusion protein